MLATKPLALDETLQAVVDELQRITSVSVIADLEDLNDVNITTPSDGQALIYDNANAKWINGNVSGGIGAIDYTNPVLSQTVTSWNTPLEYTMQKDGIAYVKIKSNGSNWMEIYINGNTVLATQGTSYTDLYTFVLKAGDTINKRIATGLSGNPEVFFKIYEST